MVSDLKVAESWLSRLRGLLFKKELAPREGLWLIPCQSIHMFGMQFPIDALYLDQENRVVRLIRHLKPNQIGPVDFKTYSVLEMKADTLNHFSISPGDQLEIIP